MAELTRSIMGPFTLVPTVKVSIYNYIYIYTYIYIYLYIYIYIDVHTGDNSDW